MKKYSPQKIEKKWQEIWEKQNSFKVQNNSKKKKFYLLVEFPFLSGEGLHVGHCRSYAALDIIARKRRMEGLNVLFPIGWDAFGLPTENFAIKKGVQPQAVVKKNADNFRRQLKMLGFSFSPHLSHFPETTSSFASPILQEGHQLIIILALYANPFLNNCKNIH